MQAHRWRPALAEVGRHRRPVARDGARGARRSPRARRSSTTLDDLLDAGARRRRHRHAERAARRAVDRGRWSAASRCSARSRSAAPPRKPQARGRRGPRGRPPARRRPLLPLHRGHARASATLVASGELGHVYAVDLVFHNAYGPDKPWFYDPRPVGRRLRDGPRRPPRRPGAVDAGLSRRDRRRSSQLFAGGRAAGRPRRPGGGLRRRARSTLAGGAVVRLACSWRLQAGLRRRDRGRLLRDARAARRCATSTARSTTSAPSATAAPPGETLAAPPDAWGGRAAADWARRLAAGARFDPKRCGSWTSAASSTGSTGRPGS